MRFISLVFSMVFASGLLLAAADPVVATAPVKVVKKDASVVDQKEEQLVSMKTSVLSKYIKKGVVVSDDPVAQSDISLNYKGFELEFFGNMDLTDEHSNSAGFNNDAFDVNNIDVDFSYTFLNVLKNDKLDVKLGTILFTYPDSDVKRESTAEAYIKPSYKLPANLTASLLIAYDYSEVDAWHFMPDLEHKLDLPKLAAKIPHAKDARLKSHVGVDYGSSDYNDYYYGYNDNNVVDLIAGTALEVDFTKNFGIALSVCYDSIICGEIQDNLKQNDDVVFGFSTIFKF